ncbi:hypothetical protein SeMB42_g07364 [Synchytrium endobioticum]|uniref:Magnesium-dependent phosphatase-1 n=1 Tax=Synchytrium endobioticum TaxID=286115 RepID=A0A507C9E1_9FUNG|nr:hypothetical protein SeMB42_g07364 [Synchytrium endobioticum]
MSGEKTMHPLHLNKWKRFPELVVFDLDFTIWPVYMDSYTSGPPFKRAANFAIQDRAGDKVCLYPDVHDIMYSIKTAKLSTKIGIASRSHTPEWCRAALALLTIRAPSHPPLAENHPDHKPILSYIDQHEIYPGSKVSHFKQLSKRLGVPYTSMVFFDDEPRNIKESRQEQSNVMANWLAGGSSSKTSRKVMTDMANHDEDANNGKYEDDGEEFIELTKDSASLDNFRCRHVDATFMTIGVSDPLHTFHYVTFHNPDLSTCNFRLLEPGWWWNAPTPLVYTKVHDRPTVNAV